jgi:tetratricopeptide (TPR) repeat protein
VQVYAAGALGYEILTGQPPDPRKGPGPELTGPAADVVRIAMARDRRERFGDLHQLREAVDALQQPADPDAERHAFVALVARGDKAGPAPDLGRAALTKLIEHVGQLGRQMEAVRSGLADGQRDQRDLLARVAVLESRGESAAAPAPAPARKSSGAGLAVLAGMLGAALAVVLLGVLVVKMPRLGGRLWRTAVGAPGLASLGGAPASIAGPSPVANASPAQPAPVVSHADPQPVAVATVVPTPTQAAPPSSAPATTTSVPDARPVNAAPEKPAPAPPKPSQAEMARAVAEAQVRRGDQELERGRYDVAAEEFQLALANDPSLAVAWRGLGIAHLMRHNEESARKAYVKYLQLAPSAPDARDIRKAIAELTARAKIGAGTEK